MVGGDVIGTVPETPVVLHKIMVPPNLKGTLKSVAAAGTYNVKQTVAVLTKEDGTDVELTMSQRWPVRVGRPYKHKYPPPGPCPPGSESWTPSSPWPRAVLPLSPAPSARVRR